MIQSPLVEPEALADRGPIRLHYVPAGGGDAPIMRRVPIDASISHAKQTQSGLDDVAYWRNAITKLGLGPDAMTVVLDDGRMTEAARVWFILQYFGLPAAVLNGGLGRSAACPKTFRTMMELSNCAPVRDLSACADATI